MPLACASAAQAAFGLRAGSAGFAVGALAEGGGPASLAGSHPYEIAIKLGFNLSGAGPYTEGDLRELRIEEPPGLIENPAALPKCSSAAFHTPRVSPFEASASGESCPQASQVGIATLHTSRGGGSARTFGLFDLEPAPGAAAQLGFAPYGVPIVLSSQVRPGAGGEYALNLETHDFPQAFDLSELELVIWGAPWGVSHNGQRGNCLNEAEPLFPWAKCSVGKPLVDPPRAYLTLPTACGGPLGFAVRASAWQGGEASAAALGRGVEGQPAELRGCEGIVFDPHPFGRLTDKKASSPSGFNFQLLNNDETLTDPASQVHSQVRGVVLRLPEGVTINPSVGAGLGVCTPGSYARESATSPPGAGCPNAAKIGDFTVRTPLFAETLGGAIYLAAPFENPFGQLLAIYLVAKSPARGVLVKVAGKLSPDPASGRLTASFEDLPQLPYTNLEVDFRPGQRAPLVTPSSCGIHYTEIEMAPWAGVAQTAHATSENEISSGIGGGPCPSGAAPPFEPKALGGSLNSAAGAYSPFYLHLTRTDSEQEITTYSASFPPGLTGKIAAIPYCPEAAIEAAKRSSGSEELERPSCPAASEIGHTIAGYGVGAALTYAPGRLYLAGPYHGSAFSVVAIDSALVGPFDLGVVVVRSAIRVDPHTAQVSIDSTGSDPIPHIIDGIPLHLRDIRVYISRHELTLNPTNCEPLALSSTLSGSSPPFANPFGTSATATVRYQAFDCGSLGFAPRFAMKLRGATKRGAYPALRAVLRERAGDANIGRAVVTLPRTEFLAQNHIRGVCSGAQFAAGRCPASSVYGYARAFTPLLSAPLQGPVYLRSSANPLPDMVAALRGDGIAIDLDGRIDAAPSGGMRASFEVLPDAPASKVLFTLAGGRRGILVNAADLCRAPSIATARFAGQDNTVEALRLRLGTGCRKHRKHGR